MNVRSILSLQLHRECTALSRFARDLYRAFMRFGNPLHNGEAQSEASVLPGARLVPAVKASEDVGGGFGWNTNSGIGNQNAKLVLRGFQLDRNFPGGRSVADGVVEQVQDQAAQQLLIAAEGHVIRATAFEPDLPGAGGGFDRPAAFGQ